MARKATASPSAEPPDSGNAGTAGGATPSATPPGTAEGGSGGEMSTPRELSSEEMAMTGRSGSGSDTGPTQQPPAEAASGGVTAWNNGKKIVGLWGINQNRNSWVLVEGVGWKRLADNSDSAVVALTIASANARLTGGAVNYRDEADGKIHEIYVW